VNRPIALLVAFLLFLPAVLITYRVIFLAYPLFPTTPERAWELSMDARIKPDEKEVKIMIGLPFTHAGQIVTEEKIISGALAFNLFREGPNQIGVWSGDVGAGGEIISYRATILIHPQRPSKAKPPMLEPYPENVGKTEQALVMCLVGKWSRLEPPDRLRAISAILMGVGGEVSLDERDIKAWSVLQEKYGRIKALLILLRAASLPARIVEGFWLTESVTNSPFPWIEVWTGKEWENMMPLTGKIFQGPTTLLPLTTGGLSAVRVSHGEMPILRWTLNKQIISQWRHHFERIIRSNRLLDRWSLFHLPEEFQRTFRILLLVPIGALMISLLRNLVGFPTFGIFMPVLMALAFRNTGLAYGLGIFAGVVLIGFVVRRWIDRLRLLLVPRLSFILTLVIACITIFALVGGKLGLREFMAVGLLPFVILTMTIERFFVIVEEAGAREGFRTAVGTAVVATITHEILHLEPLQLTFFVYPEVLFVVAAAQVILGRYTGYRLSEFLRFQRFRSSS
jgi:hypothetical protein